MKIPNKIKVGGHWIDISKVDSKSIDGLRAGDYDGINSMIRINIDRFSKSMQGETLLHEILEAIKEFNILDLEHKDLTVLSQSLFQVMRDNKLNFTETK